MKIVVFGGTGLIGGSAALHLKNLGHDVSIAARSAPQEGSDLAGLEFIECDYTSASISSKTFEGFDALVFAAAQDPRHIAPGCADEDIWKRVNEEAIPRLFELAKAAGVRSAINVGSFYPWVRPELVETFPYIRSRLVVDEAVCGLNAPGFRTVSLNPPYVLGLLPGTHRGSFGRILRYAKGMEPGLEIYAPTGGVNFMSTRSLSAAIEGALDRGRAGHSYLVGDQNLSFREYFQAYFDASGGVTKVPEREKEHPLIGSFAGLGGTLYFEPNEEERLELNYPKLDVLPTIRQLVEAT